MWFFVLRASFCLSLFGSLPFLMPHRIRIPPALISVEHRTEWETPSIAPDLFNILALQKWTYFARGNQAYVFESQDGQYVLKLFRYRFTRFPCLHVCKNVFHKKPKDSFAVKIHKTAFAAKIAGTEAEKFTQVLFCHLNLTHGTLPIAHLEIPSGTYDVPLDRLRFVLQKKVTSFVPAFLEARQDPLKMRAMIHSFVDLLKERASLGILNSDPNVLPNYGFLETSAVEMDFGNYRKSQDPQKQKDEFRRKTFLLRNWLYFNAPEYVNYISELIIDI